MSEDEFDEGKLGQLLEWIYEVDQVTDSDARNHLVEQIKSLPQEIYSGHFQLCFLMFHQMD